MSVYLHGGSCGVKSKTIYKLPTGLRMPTEVGKAQAGVPTDDHTTLENQAESEVGVLLKCRPNTGWHG